jgi:4,5-DOPA dioxygenase extradiol
MFASVGAARPTGGADAAIVPVRRVPRTRAPVGRRGGAGRGYETRMPGDRMPSVFVGHGNPMNALSTSAWTEGWRAIAASMPRPRAIVSVSAHWFVPGTRVTSGPRPPTIHDFGGFPRPLHEVRYPASGAPEIADRIRRLLAPAPVVPDDGWGLDHGTWSVLIHMYPDASVPVVQLALDETAPAPDHVQLARRLRPLRDEGVLVLGSGNVVHNLHAYAWGRRAAEPYDWAVRFEARVRSLVEACDLDALAAYEALGEDAALSAPTPDHFLPLLYVLAQREGDDPVAFPVEGFDGGSVSMLAVRVG